MAAFCNYCAKHMWGDKDDDLQPIPPDIDVYAEFKKLEPDTYISVGICEGCDLVAVANIKGELKVAYLTESKDGQPVAYWDEYKDKSRI